MAIYEKYEERAFRGKSLELIEKADDIIRDYTAQGYTLSLRQLYYQFVSRGIIENSVKSYDNLGALVTAGRDAGLLPWDGIEDRNRELATWLIQEDVLTILEELPQRYAADMWANQDFYVEVWVEKDALSSVVERAVNTFRVPYMACKGYLSASEAWRAGQRMRAAIDRGKEPVVIHLGDHDPSGIDMSRDNLARLEKYSRIEGLIDLRRIALNMDQVRQYNPPENPAKMSDSRAEDYVSRFGTSSWELDALEPTVVVDLIRANIRSLVNWERWDEDHTAENRVQRDLAQVGERWDDILGFLSGDNEQEE